MSNHSAKAKVVVKPEPIEHRVFQDLNSRPNHLMSAKVKPEPVDAVVASRVAGPSTSTAAAVTPQIKSDPVSPPKPKIQPKEEPGSPKQAVTAPPAPAEPYLRYHAATEIPYTPETALETGLSMVQLIKEKMKKLDIGSKLRKEVWKKDLDALTTQGAPTTLIAICGATGAGKSSVINALLDDAIVPTSGMRACTAVVTEISYKPGKSIDADVSFLSREEWKTELTVLLEDLTDDDGQLRRASDLRSDAGIAWHKVHAVYPNIALERLIQLTPDEIIGRDKTVEKFLGSTQRITANNGKDFGKQIAKYIDSKEKKRGKDDKKDKSEGPALWPLIRTVRVRCPAKALETGAVLVDLPGTQDSNKARASIATDYMQRCQCIWILAPIQRAVDDKVAKDLLGKAFKTQLLMDGNYDTTTVSFIATKTDDLSCNEIITALNLEDNDELQEIEQKLDQYHEESKEQKTVKADAEKEVKSLGAEHKNARAILLELQEHLRALEKNEPFEPKLTARKGSQSTPSKSSGSKKRRRGGDDGGSKKRRKSSPGDSGDSESDNDMSSDDDVISEPDSDASSNSDNESYRDPDESDSESPMRRRKARDSDDEDDDFNDSQSDDDDDDIEMVEDVVEEVTKESLTEQIKAQKEEVKKIKQKSAEAKDVMKEAGSQLSTLKKKIAKAQREKNRFCSLARNQYSRDALKVDWRAGVKEMDQEAAMQNDPDNFDPARNYRDYEAIDLPTFTVSSRDYIRITRQAQGDGEPTSFTDRADTQIPALQEWCHSLTISSRERAARTFLAQLKAFATSVESYLTDMSNVKEVDRATLRNRWASEKEGVAPGTRSASPEMNMLDLPRFRPYWDEDSDDSPEPERKRERTPHNANGVAPTLKKGFEQNVDKTVEDLQEIFAQSLKEKLAIGCHRAEAAAVETSDNFAASMHWNSYRAALRRDGEWRGDLNADLCTPLTKSIAMSWSQVFEQDLLAQFERKALALVKAVIEAIEKTSPAGLKDRCRSQGEIAMEEAHVTMKQLVEVVNDALQSEQKEISRCLAPHVRLQLMEGYQTAAAERGRGSVARQKALFRNFVQSERQTLFVGGSSLLMERLDKAAEAVGVALDNQLVDLANKVEVGMSVLWEGGNVSPSQLQYRGTVVGQVRDILQQIQLWTTAERIRHLPVGAAAV